MADEADVITITIKGKVYKVPKYSRIERLLLQIIKNMDGGGGVPEGYTIATDSDIDNLFP